MAQTKFYQMAELLMHSPSLKGNLLGCSPDRHVAVYLPPSYHNDEDRRYPVLYRLHGNSGSSNQHDFYASYGEPVHELMDTLIAEGSVKEMIIVQPVGRHKYGGCQYANSPVSGNWADFIVKDLVQYIDLNYRTLANSASRGLTGGSMGGRGVFPKPQLIAVPC